MQKRVHEGTREADGVGGAVRRHLVLGAILVLALGARVAWIAAARFEPTLSDDAGRYDFLGRSLASGGGFINPNGNTTMFWPPGYPFILAAVYKLYPHWLLADHSLRAALLLNALLGTATVLLVYAIGARVFGRRAGLVAAAMVALFPSLVFFAGVTLSETAFTFLLMLAVWLTIEAEGRDRRLLLVAGLVVGYAALVRGQALLLPLVFLPFWWRAGNPQRTQRDTDGGTTGHPQITQMTQMAKEGEPQLSPISTDEGTRDPPMSPRGADGVANGRALWQEVALRVVMVGGPAAVVVLPWTVRNYVASKSLVVISSNAGVDFYIGNSAAADGRGRIVDKLVFRYPELPPAEAEARVSGDGFREGLSYAVRHPLREVELAARKVFWLYYRDDEAVSWIDGHGERYVLSSGVRRPLQVLSDVYYYALIALAIAGVRRWSSLREPARLLLVALAAYWTLVHVAFFGDPRFHAPIMPVLALWAGEGMIRAWARIRLSTEKVE